MILISLIFPELNSSLYLFTVHDIILLIIIIIVITVQIHMDQGRWISQALTHLEVREEALILKNVDLDWHAMHLPISVLPVPGGPNNNKPFGGPRSPVKMSLKKPEQGIII